MTRDFQITEDWTQVADGPCLIEAVEGAAHLHFGTERPDAQSKAFHKLYRPDNSHISYGGTLKTWARAGDATADIVVTEGI